MEDVIFISRESLFDISILTNKYLISVHLLMLSAVAAFVATAAAAAAEYGPVNAAECMSRAMQLQLEQQQLRRIRCHSDVSDNISNGFYIWYGFVCYMCVFRRRVRWLAEGDTAGYCWQSRSGQLCEELCDLIFELRDWSIIVDYYHCNRRACFFFSLFYWRQTANCLLCAPRNDPCTECVYIIYINSMNRN